MGVPHRIPGRRSRASAGAWLLLCGALSVSAVADEPTLTVRVLGPDGSPVPRARVAYAVQVENGVTTYSREAIGGVARFELRSAGTLHVTRPRSESDAALPLAPAFDTAVDAGAEEVTVRLAAGSTVDGVVVDPAGEPVVGVVVRGASAKFFRGFLPQGDEVVLQWGGAIARTDATGAFSLRGLPSEPIRLDCRPTGSLLPPDALEVRPGSAGVRLALVRGATAVVTFRDEAGEPVRGLPIEVFERAVSPSPPLSLRVVAATSDAEGVAVVGPLHPDRGYEMRVTPPDGSTLLGARIEDWRPAATVVVLREGYTATGVVLTVGGRPVADATVEAAGRSAVTTADGRFALRGLPHEMVQVSARVGPRDEWVPDPTLSGSAYASPRSPSIRIVLSKHARSWR